MASATKPSPQLRARKVTRVLTTDISPQVEKVVNRVLSAGGTDVRFPILSGTEAAALMQAAGIVNAKGKLGKNYR